MEALAHFQELVNNPPDKVAGRRFKDGSAVVPLPDGRVRLISPQHGYDLMMDHPAQAPLFPTPVQISKPSPVALEKLSAPLATSRIQHGAKRLLQSIISGRDVEEDRLIPEHVVQVTPTEVPVIREDQVVGTQFNFGNRPSPAGQDPGVWPDNYRKSGIPEESSHPFGRKGNERARSLTSSIAWEYMRGRARDNIYLTKKQQRMLENAGGGSSLHIPFDKDGSEVTLFLHPEEKDVISGYRIHVPHLRGAPGEEHTYERDHILTKGSKRSQVERLRHRLFMTSPDPDRPGDIMAETEHGVGEIYVPSPPPGLVEHDRRLRLRAARKGVVYGAEEQVAYERAKKISDAQEHWEDFVARGGMSLPPAFRAAYLLGMAQHGVGVADMSEFDPETYAAVRGSVNVVDSVKSLDKFVATYHRLHPYNTSPTRQVPFTTDHPSLSDPNKLYRHARAIWGNIVGHVQGTSVHSKDLMGEMMKAHQEIIQNHAYPKKPAGVNYMARLRGQLATLVRPEKILKEAGRPPTEELPDDTPVAGVMAGRSGHYFDKSNTVEVQLDSDDVRHAAVHKASTIGELKSALDGIRVTSSGDYVEPADASPEDETEDEKQTEEQKKLAAAQKELDDFEAVHPEGKTVYGPTKHKVAGHVGYKGTGWRACRDKACVEGMRTHLRTKVKRATAKAAPKKGPRGRKPSTAVVQVMIPGEEHLFDIKNVKINLQPSSRRATLTSDSPHDGDPKVPVMWAAANLTRRELLTQPNGEPATFARRSKAVQQAKASGHAHVIFPLYHLHRYPEGAEPGTPIVQFHDWMDRRDDFYKARIVLPDSGTLKEAQWNGAEHRRGVQLFNAARPVMPPVRTAVATPDDIASVQAAMAARFG